MSHQSSHGFPLGAISCRSMLLVAIEYIQYSTSQSHIQIAMDETASLKMFTETRQSAGEGKSLAGRLTRSRRSRRDYLNVLKNQTLLDPLRSGSGTSEG